MGGSNSSIDQLAPCTPCNSDASRNYEVAYANSSKGEGQSPTGLPCCAETGQEATSTSTVRRPAEDTNTSCGCDQSFGCENLIVACQEHARTPGDASGLASAGGASPLSPSVEQGPAVRRNFLFTTTSGDPSVDSDGVVPSFQHPAALKQKAWGPSDPISRQPGVLAPVSDCSSPRSDCSLGA